MLSTVSRVAIAGAALGGGLLLAGPAAAQTSVCPYPFDTCVQPEQTIKPTKRDTAVRNEQIARTTSTPSALPFTGTELTLLGLAGAGAVAGGVALVVAGRRRASA